MSSDLLKDLRKNDMRVISRLLSLVENGDRSVDGTLDTLFPHAQDSVRIGITGPPGVGKSTILDKFILHMRTDGKSVGVIAIDPTSPFSGGAFLGDRIRMNQHALDPGVFIRSMGSRGQTGGLAKMSHHAADVLASTGKDYILLETIGVGQAETEVVDNVDITVVVFVPESGDEIQFMKAGPVEVGDIFVINKADREGAHRMARVLGDTVKESFHGREFVPRIFLTVATKGEGMKQLYRECIDLVGKLKESGTFARRRQAQYLARVRNAVRDELSRQFWSDSREEVLSEKVARLGESNVSPYEAARELVRDLSL